MSRTSPNVTRSFSGLLPDNVWNPYLTDFDALRVSFLRHGLVANVPGLCESFNKKVPRYFGYFKKNERDNLYIYIQKKKLVVDINLNPNFANYLISLGFTVSLRRNLQERDGWLTGWDIPNEIIGVKRQQILAFMVKVF
jgi:hypothetical protein